MIRTTTRNTLAYEEAIAAGLLERQKWGTESPWRADPLEGEDELRRCEAQERTGEAVASVDGTGGAQPDGQAFVDEAARRALLDQGDFEFDLMVDLQDILDSDREQSPSDDRDDVGEPSIADDDLMASAPTASTRTTRSRRRLTGPTDRSTHPSSTKRST